MAKRPGNTLEKWEIAVVKANAGVEVHPTGYSGLLLAPDALNQSCAHTRRRPLPA